IDYYIRENHWLGFAGGYAIQQLFSLVVERIEGSYTNIVGLPMETLYTMLNDIGFRMGM
ncbi:MAG: Maf family protein, partial [Spirochaetales bacterium]|nr:Maf family protein [Spirochaetales bacterium]